MNIRPMDLQVMIPRTIDVAKIASVNEQQAATQQQQLSVRLKQTVDEQQRQVQTKLSAQHDGRVTTEDLDSEKQQKRRQPGGRDEDEKSAGADSANAGPRAAANPSDPLRGHTIDIKT